MARTIQPSHSRNPGAKAFLGPLIAAVFWVVIALKFPVERIADWIPELAPFAPLVTAWATPLFLVLALWSFIRAGRSLVGIANSRHAQASRSLPGARPAKGGVTKAAPTVQRMR